MIRLHPTHPYLKLRLYEPVIVRVRDNLWSVKYRSFNAIRQDRDFDTRQAAEAFVTSLPERVAWTNIDEDEGVEAYQAAEIFWHELAERRRCSG